MAELCGKLLGCGLVLKNIQTISYCIGGSGDETTSIVPSVTKNFSGVGTNFVLRGLRCIGRGGPKQHYIIMSNKINKDRIHTWKFYIVQHTVGSNLNCFQPKIWSPSAWYSIIHGAWLLEGGGRPPLLDCCKFSYTVYVIDCRDKAQNLISLKMVASSIV